MITSSEIAIVRVIDILIQGGREEQYANQIPIFTSKDVPLSILNFISDLSVSEKVDKFVNAAAFFEVLEEYVAEETGVLKRVRESLQFTSVDDFIDMMDSIPLLLLSPAGVNPNGSFSPFTATPESTIGLILRTVSTSWQNTFFEDICTIFDNFKLFLSGGKRSFQNDCDGGEHNGYFYSQVDSYLRMADRSSKLLDVVPAMDDLHRYYDLSTQDSYLFSDLLSSGGPNPSKRHQQAMLTMATVWIRSGNVLQAVCAVEETLKQAHQRGDHASVSQALLLLQHILMLNGTSNDATLRSVAATLQQLIVRCSDLKLRSLATQARLLLSKVKTRRPIRLSQSNQLYGFDAADAKSIDATCSPQDIWSDLLLVQLGENVISERVISQPYQAAYRKDMSADGPLTTEELGSISLQATIIAADFWCRLGLYDMAELECRRCIRKCVGRRSYQNNREELLHVFTFCARLRAMISHDSSILTLFYGSYDRNAAATTYEEALGILICLKSLLNLEPSEPLYKHYHVSLLTIKLWRAISANKIEIALKLVTILLELLEVDSIDLTPEVQYVEANLIYSQLLEFGNPHKAMLERLHALQLSSRFNMTLLSGEANLLHAMAQYKLYPYDINPSKIVIRSVQEIGKAELYPKLEFLVNECTKIISTQS